MMMRKAGTIDQSTDFQLAYTACVRTFCVEQEPDMLKKLKQLYVDYLPYWETKTLFVAARDLLDSLGYSPYDFSPYPFGISQESDLGKAMFPFVSSLLECIKARSQTDEGKYCTIREFRLEKTPFGGHIYRENGLPYEAFLCLHLIRMYQSKM